MVSSNSSYFSFARLSVICNFLRFFLSSFSSSYRIRNIFHTRYVYRVFYLKIYITYKYQNLFHQSAIPSFCSSFIEKSEGHKRVHLFFQEDTLFCSSPSSQYDCIAFKYQVSLFLLFQVRAFIMQHAYCPVLPAYPFHIPDVYYWLTHMTTPGPLGSPVKRLVSFRIILRST